MFPDFLPAAVHDLTEATSIAWARQIQQRAVPTSLSDRPIPTTYGRQGSGALPIWLLHGFDSSLLEFRRLVPELACQYDVWAVDLLGFGFSDRTVYPSLSPEAIKLHLHSFWQQQGSQPMVLVGASMGGAAALDFALTYPAAVSHLVLLDSAGFVAGPVIGRFLVPPLDRWATAFLKNPRVRRSISRQAYCDPRWVTPDAELCASLHVACPQWSEGLIAFTKSGGYNFLSPKISQISMPTLILWGRQDRILGTKDAAKFRQAIAQSHLVWLDQCGHVPHLECPKETAAAIAAFLQPSQPQSANPDNPHRSRQSG